MVVLLFRWYLLGGDEFSNGLRFSLNGFSKRLQISFGAGDEFSNRLRISLGATNVGTDNREHLNILLSIIVRIVGKVSVPFHHGARVVIRHINNFGISMVASVAMILSSDRERIP